MRGLTGLALLALVGPAGPARAERSIEPVKGDVYRFVDDRHRSVLLVTDEGILLTDPLNPDAAAWLRGELERRFEAPVRFVVYSHNHSDHVYGGEVFERPGVAFVAQRQAREDLVVTGARTVIPAVTFDRRMDLHLGESRVTLRHHGRNDGRGSISALFEPSGVLFVADWIVVGRMPWQKLWSYDIHGMIDSTREVLTLDFEVFVGAHAEVGTRQDVERYLDYLVSLRAAVVDHVQRGSSLEKMREEIRLDRFSDFDNYREWLPLNVEGVYERLMEESGLGWRPDVP